jgi:uncharacterized protein
MKVESVDAGINDLEELLSSMAPNLIEGEYVFCTFPNGKYGDYEDMSPLATFMESEGLTLVVNRENANRFKLKYDAVFRCITLSVHSSLEAVGLTAAVSAKLSEHQISANVIAAYFHDHVFVPAESAELALKLLSEFST